MFLHHTQRRTTVGRTHLLKSWVRIPPGAWIFVCCECRVLSGRGLCDELITRTEESYRMCCVVVCDLETSRMGAPYIYIYIYIYDISRLRVNSWNTLVPKKVSEFVLLVNGFLRCPYRVSWWHDTDRFYPRPFGLPQQIGIIPVLHSVTALRYLPASRLSHHRHSIWTCIFVYIWTHGLLWHVRTFITCTWSVLYLQNIYALHSCRKCAPHFETGLWEDMSAKSATCPKAGCQQ